MAQTIISKVNCEKHPFQLYSLGDLEDS